MQILLTAHGLRCHKPAYAASDASQQDWQDGCMRATLDPRGLRDQLSPPLFKGLERTGGNPNKLSSPLPSSREECDRPACSRLAIRFACPCPGERAALMIWSVRQCRGEGPLGVGGCGGPSQMSRIPPADRQSISRLPSCYSLAALAPIRDIPHGRMVYGRSGSPPAHPSSPFPVTLSQFTHAFHPGQKNSERPAW